MILMSDAQVEDIVKCPECGSRELVRDETQEKLFAPCAV